MAIIRICQTAKVECDECHFRGEDLIYPDRPIICPRCSAEAFLADTPRFGTAPGLITDEIPGGIEIRHGLVNDDGTPRTFYSKTDMKRAANEAGLNWADDTPGPYKVNWSGRRKEPEKVEPIAKVSPKAG